MMEYGWEHTIYVLMMLAFLALCGAAVWFFSTTKSGLTLLRAAVVLFVVVGFIAWLAGSRAGGGGGGGGNHDEQVLAAYGDEVMKLRQTVDAHAVAGWTITDARITSGDDGATRGVVEASVTGVGGRTYPFRIRASWDAAERKWTSLEEIDLRLRLLELQERRVIEAQRLLEQLGH